jgi:restriction system protein
MARRKRGKSSGAEVLALLLLVGVPLVVIVAVISAIARNPVLLVLLLGGGGGLVAWRVNARQKQARELAETRRRQAEIYAARVQAIGSYYSMSAREFEQALAWLCRRDGCPEAHATGKAGDLGADVRAVTPDGRILVIQAKRYTPGNLVTGPDLQKFGGTCYSVHHAQVAAVVTTSAFTKQAREYAAAMRIVLFDHDALGGWVARNGPPPWLMVPPPASFVPRGDTPRGKHSRPSTRPQPTG